MLAKKKSGVNLTGFTVIISNEQLARKIRKRVKRLRKKAGATVGQLAETSKISASQIRKIESGNIVPTLVTMIKLAAAFGVSLDYMILGVKPKRDKPRAKRMKAEKAQRGREKRKKKAQKK